MTFRTVIEKEAEREFAEAVYFSIKAETAELVISTIWQGNQDPAKLRRRLK